MSRRSDIERILPIDKRQELDEKLYRNGFSEYQQLSDWLKESGYDIGKSAVHRYGQKLQKAQNIFDLNIVEEKLLQDIRVLLNEMAAVYLKRQIELSSDEQELLDNYRQASDSEKIVIASVARNAEKKPVLEENYGT